LPSFLSKLKELFVVFFTLTFSTCNLTIVDDLSVSSYIFPQNIYCNAEGNERYLFVEAIANTTPMNNKPISRIIVFSTLAFTLVFDTKNLPDDEKIKLANTEFHASFSTLLKCFDEYERFIVEGKAFIFHGMELRSMNCYLLYENGNSSYKVHHYRFHQYMNLTPRRYNDTCMVFPYLSLKVCYKMVTLWLNASFPKPCPSVPL
jgi:hypothetical protein